VKIFGPERDEETRKGEKYIMRIICGNKMPTRCNR
jgi:hypothetical protein